MNIAAVRRDNGSEGDMGVEVDFGKAAGHTEEIHQGILPGRKTGDNGHSEVLECFDDFQYVSYQR